MKKIKGLLFGIVSILGIGFSFGYTYHGGNSVFKYIEGVDSEYLTTLNIFDRGYSNNNPGFAYSFGSRILNSSSWGLFNNYIFANFDTSSFPFSLQNFYSSGGLEFFGSTGSSFISLNTGNSLLFSRTVDYLTRDSFPLIYDYLGNYLTFSGDNFIVYNGNFFPIINVNSLHYCFYGDGFSLSCLFSDDSDLGFVFKSFLVSSTGNINTYNNFAIIPIGYDTTNNGKITSQGITLVLSYGFYNNNNSQGVIYNLYNCYSSDPEYLKTCNLNSKGYFNINSSDFFHRRFLSVYNNKSIYGFGSFSSIYYDDSDFYFTSNGYGFATTYNTDLYQGLHFGRSKLLDYFYNDESVVNILNNIVSETNTFSGSINLPTCVNTEMCTYYTGSDGVTQIYSCTTYCLESGDLQPDGSYISVLGDIYFEKSTLDLGKTLKNKNPEYLFSSGYIDSGDLLSVTYFNDLFDNGAKAIGVCPFNYYPGPLDFLSEVEIQNVYPFMPLLCFYSAFQQGKQTHYFDNSELFPDTYFSSPLLSGSSEKYLLLFRFFDVLLSIGILYLFKSLVHIF